MAYNYSAMGNPPLPPGAMSKHNLLSQFCCFNSGMVLLQGGTRTAEANFVAGHDAV